VNNILTASRQNCLLSCPRRQFWQYEVGLRSTSEAVYLRFGSAWARGMEAMWKGATYEQALDAALPEGVDLDEVAVATLSALLAAYYSHHAGNELIKEMHPEVEFDVPLEGSRTFRVAGKMDGLGVLTNGTLVIIEHKTTSDSLDSGSDYWLRLRFNTQILQYVDAARIIAWDVSNVLYDVTRKPSIAPKLIAELDEQGRKVVKDAAGNRVYKKDGTPRLTGDSAKGYEACERLETPEEFATRLVADVKARPDFYFARREVPILDGDLEAFRTQRLVLSRLILACRAAEKRVKNRADAWARNVSADTCNFCAYQSFCLQNINIDINQPPAGFTVGPTNPELSAVVTT
jgi:hypothetical protein